jgi:tetratricopeptide (TPR) repeat protein
MVLVNLASALVQLDRPGEALDVLGAAEDLHPDAPMVQVNLAACLLALERPAEALARAERALEIAPEFAHGHLLRAEALVLLGEPERALEALRTAHRHDPDHPRILETLAEQCLDTGLHQEAIEHYAHLGELLPGSWQAQTELVRACVLGNDLARAGEAMARALELAPGEPRVLAMAAELGKLSDPR